MIVVALSMLIFTSTVSILAGLQSAPSSFAAGESVVISESSAPTIFSSQVDMDIVSALDSWSHPVNLSPEVFAFSSWDGRSFVLRGVDLDRFNSTGPAFTRFEILGGQSPKDESNAIIGARLLERLRITLPFTMSLVGSYSDKLDFVRIVGSFETHTSLDDELFVSLEVARHLSGMPEDKSSIIRVSTIYQKELRELLSPDRARFVLYDLWQSKSIVALNDSIQVTVGLRNWGRAVGNVTVTFSDIGGIRDRAEITLEGLTSTTIRRNFSFHEPSVGQRIQVSLGGDFPSDLYAFFRVVEPFLVVSARSVAVLGTDIEVKVTDYTGEPVSNATVQFQGDSSLTDSGGLATVNAAQVASSELTASHIGYIQGSFAVQVLDPASVVQAFAPVVSSLDINPSSILQGERTTGTVVVVNEGNLSGTFETGVYVDGMPFRTINISLGPLESAIATINLGDQSVGGHVVQVGSRADSFFITPWYADNSGLVRLILRYGGSTSVSSAGSVPIYQAAKISEGNVAVTLFSVGAISALLAGLAITAVFSKEVRESRRRLGVLKTIGAPREAIRRIVFPQALEAGLGGAAVGVALGIIIVDRLSSSGTFMLFGHGLRVDIDTTLMLLIMLSAVLISVFSAMVSTMQAVRETTISSIRSLAEEPSGQLDVDDLLRDD
jgi:ABC-type lipoprotein release transport system permease subunit